MGERAGFSRPIASGVVLAGAFWISGCRTAAPELEARIEARASRAAASDAVYRGSAPFERKALAVGQWTEHLGSLPKSLRSLLRQEVIAARDGGFWIRQVLTTPYEESEVRFFVVPSEEGSGGVWEFRKIQLFGKDGSVRELRAREEVPAFLVPYAVSAGGTESAPGGAAGEAISVLAGRFEGCVVVEADDARQWLHAAVPITGIVKEVATDGDERWELAAFGWGAAAKPSPKTRGR